MTVNQMVATLTGITLSLRHESMSFRDIEASCGWSFEKMFLSPSLVLMVCLISVWISKSMFLFLGEDEHENKIYVDMCVL